MNILKSLFKNFFMNILMKRLTKLFPGIAYYQLAFYASIMAIILGGTSIVSGVLIWWLWEFIFIDQVLAWIFIIIGYILFRLGKETRRILRLGEENFKKWLNIWVEAVNIRWQFFFFLVLNMIEKSIDYSWAI